MALTAAQRALLTRITIRSGQTGAPRRCGTQGGGLLSEDDEKVLQDIAPVDLEYSAGQTKQPPITTDPPKEIDPQ